MKRLDENLMKDYDEKMIILIQENKERRKQRCALTLQHANYNIIKSSMISKQNNIELNIFKKFKLYFLALIVTIKISLSIKWLRRTVN